MNIDKFLTTKKGATALMAKLIAMSDDEKQKDSYKIIWQEVCNALDKFDKEDKQAKIKASEETPIPNKAIKPIAKKQQNKPKQSTIKPLKVQQKKPVHKYTKEEIKQTIDSLCIKYPKLFDLDNPKPLAIGLDKIIITENDIDVDLLKSSIGMYVKSEAYSINFLKSEYRYNLEGHDCEQITVDEKEYQKLRLNGTLGRFVMQDKYPELMPHLSVPKPIAIKNGVTMYYYDNFHYELNYIVKDCYGRQTGIGHSYSEINSPLHTTYAKILKDNKSILEEQGIASTKKASKNIATFKLLVKFQNEVDAYSFEYDKPKIDDEVNNK
jgi:hypothetical protein